jgi:hypothetical protein
MLRISPDGKQVLLEGFRLRPLVKSARLSRAFVGLADSLGGGALVG